MIAQSDIEDLVGRGAIDGWDVVVAVAGVACLGIRGRTSVTGDPDATDPAATVG